MPDEVALFASVSAIIEKRKHRAAAYANREVTLMFWEVGKYLSSVLLNGGRGKYGDQIVSRLSTQLIAKYGKSFELRNLRRMVQFSNKFSDLKIVSTLSTQLSWSHIVELLPLKSIEAQLYYAQDVAERNLGVKSFAFMNCKFIGTWLIQKEDTSSYWIFFADGFFAKKRDELLSPSLTLCLSAVLSFLFAQSLFLSSNFYNRQINISSSI